MHKTLIYSTLFFCVAIIYSCQSTKGKESTTVDEVEVSLEIDEELQTGNETIDTLIIEEDLINEVFLTYSRGYCFGMCPVFNSTILTDGTVHYEGINFVDVMGKNMSQINTADLKLIKDKLKEINYFELDSIYDNEMVTDLPSVKTSATLADRSNSVMDRYKAPKELNQLYNLLDNLFSQLEWTPVSETE